MPRESFEARKQRVAKTGEILRATYPNAHCELTFSNPLELLVATILSAQCTDKQVNIVTAGLFPKYRTAADFAAADPDVFALEIRRIGLYRNKAKNIQACCRKLVERYRGEVPKTLEELVSLDGVGRKTANVVLGNAFGINSGVVVDTHVARLSGRLKFTTETTPEKIEADLIRLVPRDEWTDFSHQLIWHGRRRCSARSPDCAGCELKALCPSAGKL